MTRSDDGLAEEQVASLIAELLVEWRTTCRLTGLPWSDRDAAAFIAQAYPCNRLVGKP